MGWTITNNLLAMLHKQRLQMPESAYISCRKICLSKFSFVPVPTCDSARWEGYEHPQRVPQFDLSDWFVALGYHLLPPR